MEPPVVVDSGTPPMPCSSPDGCRSVDGVCRQSECRFDVPCSDDLECGLGERCVGHQCRFRGCVANSECATGSCDSRTYSCAECGENRDCPDERPVCDVTLRQCQQCTSDVQCAPPGPGHCSGGRCVGCLTDTHCPNGLRCGANHSCVGVASGSACPMGTTCAADLTCVNVNQAPTCLPTCNLYQSNCAANQICYGLTYDTTTSLVFEAQGPIGVCFAPQSNRRGLREPCQRTATGNNCQPNLQCVPESATLSLCRAYCNPLASGGCPMGEKCIPFVGDFAGREFGVCMADNGFGARCKGDAVCRAGLSCQPYDDPSQFDRVGTVCQFNVGAGGPAAPCAPQLEADGGVTSADRACKSGKCVSDPISVPTNPYFCLGACATNADCGDAGVCDAEFLVSTAYGTLGNVNGCRPRCGQEQDCAGYGAGIGCKARVIGTASSSIFQTTCGPTSVTAGVGVRCFSNSDCRSGFCRLSDSRGVQREGVCAVPCTDDSTCDVNGAGLKCSSTAVLMHPGYDAVPVSADDQFLAVSLCAGAPCTTDDSCRTDGGTWQCAVTPTADSPLSTVELRCQPPTAGLLRGGAACTRDSECASGTCGFLRPPSVGTFRACFEPCDGTTACPSGTTCRVGGFQVSTPRGSTLADSCAP